MREHRQYPIGLLGQGLIHQSVRRHLENSYPIIPLAMEASSQQLAAGKLIVFCSDIWTPQTLANMNCRCLQADVALLPVYTQFGAAIVGPCIIPKEKGCTDCAELRKLGAITSETEREFVRQHLYEERAPVVAQPWLSSFSIEMLTMLVIEEIAAYFHQPDQLRTRSALLSISLETLDCSRHSFLPVSYCPACGELSRDTEEMATIALQSCPKPDVHTYRIQQPAASAEQILATYVDKQAGLISSLSANNKNLLPIATAQLYSELEDGADTAIGTGCTFHTNQSKLVAVLEAVERYAGLRPRSKLTTIKASYQQLVQQAQPVLDPTRLGLQSPEQYEQHKQQHQCHHLVAYQPDLSCHWIWGYSFQRQSPILIPEHCAYYGVPINQENPAFVYEISNGCALGNCLEEAIFHGMMEVVERDAFLLMWYARLGLPRLNLNSVSDPTIRLLIGHLEHHSGYSIHVFNATLDHAIPCLCMLGVDVQQREGMPKVHVLAGSHPQPEQALTRALRELTSSLALLPEENQQQRAHALEMLADASLVQSMPDHPQVYYLPEAFERFDFLYENKQPQQTFQEAFSSSYQHPAEHLDLRDDLENLMDYYLKRGTDIIVVDQTAPEHIPCGLRCVKVLMPGMLPMTFGQNNRRIQFERLHQLPFTLGYRDHPLTQAEINPHPHPFF
ncbi:TOMM precursor leader peptide-binding protein [Dictyobacter arantiisoli]|uniref:SagD family biosynthesis docking scaffold protein n=1 Tax=Dictyobacter arantiisoli TaxID=2014874 RepID=A0A5A5TEC9_9CHLR|nr:TOMM precursor leader peptide-binding protein [Dictyobacter arantiisoli]GCF09911.1 SagD family biosynthesis docking scaffold protein [Dictyobacter arantiisoli]